VYQSILLPVDLGHDSSWKKALPTAVEMARTFSAQLHVLCVIPDFGMSMVSVAFPANYEEEALAEARGKLESFAETHVPDDISMQCHVAHGTIYSEIIAAADKLGCDLIVLASHRPEMKDYLIGPNASRVVRHANSSVFVVRG